MKGFAMLLLLLIVFAGGLFVGGSLGVLGKPNEVYLQTDYTYGVIPYFHQGDRIHFFDPNADLVNGRYAPVDDITIPPKHTPCQDLDTNGICTIDVSSGIYKYKCKKCKDPTIPVGTNGPVNGWWDDQDQSANRGPLTLPGSSVAAFFTLSGRGRTPATHLAALANLSAYNGLYARIARDFVTAFFLPKIHPGQPVEQKVPLYPPVNASTVQAYVDCGADNKISVEIPVLWEPETAFPLAVGTKITWARQTGFSTTAQHPFTIMGLKEPSDYTAACGAPLAANSVGATQACTLAGDTSKHVVKYTIIDSSSKPTCTAPDGGFALEVGSDRVPAAGASLPGLR